MTSFGKTIKRLREDKRLTKGELAAATGCVASTLSHWESGSRKHPDPNLLEKMAPHLGVSYEYLLEAAGYMIDPAPTKEGMPHYYVEADTLEEKQLLEDYKFFIRNHKLMGKEGDAAAK